MDRRFNYKDPTKVTYFHPDGPATHWSLFEGVRILRYDEERRNVHARYMHRFFLDGLKLGLFIEGEGYREINGISFGSYIGTKSGATKKPGYTTWSAAAFANGIYNMYGATGGPAVQFQLFDYLGFHYQLTPVNRAGDFSLLGLQVVDEQIGESSQRSYVTQAGYGKVKDTGVRHNIEAVLRLYCRYEIHLGYLGENIKRKYNYYIGDTMKDGQIMSQKTYGLGLGEMITGGRITKNEIYLRFSASVFIE
jgi:hypothetical protein